MFETYPVRTEEDISIVMHREIHFGGSFSLMIEYYEQDKRGVNPELSLKRIKELALIEEKLEQNLAPLLLFGPEIEKVGKARTLYNNLRLMYENPTAETKIPRLVTDLILSEEKNPQKEINAIVKEGKAIVPSLIILLETDDFYDPLSPGYGEAPTLAAHCLGLIGDEKAIKPLFESMQREDFKHEETVIKALQAIGKPAKQFLLKLIQASSPSIDSEKAAVILLSLMDEEVSKTCLQALQNEAILQHLPLSSYLVLCCEKLASPSDRQNFADLTNNPQTPKELLEDIQMIEKNWE